MRPTLLAPLLLAKPRVPAPAATVASSSPSLPEAEASSWAALSRLLPPTPEPPEPQLTLYRDTNGWCPFCERVWLQLEAKGISHKQVLISLRDKPEWYKQMVPTALVPAIRVGEDVVWESATIMDAIEDRFHTHTPLRPADGTDSRTRSDALVGGCQPLLSAGFRFISAMRNASVAAEEKAARLADFEAELDVLQARAAEGGGPFLNGADFSIADAMYAPFLERWAVQLPLIVGFDLRQPQRWPAVHAWFDAMDALPAYAKVKGDAYSWAAVTGSFQRMAAKDGAMPEDARAVLRRGDAAAATALRSAQQYDGAADPAAALGAAAKLIANYDAVVADATNPEPKSQTHIPRLDAEEAPLVSAMLRGAAARLLLHAGALDPAADAEDVDTELLTRYTQPHEAAAYAQAARLVAARLCVPRDLPVAAATALRSVLLRIATEAESFAWRASGGLL